MALFDREIIEQVVAACESGLAEATLSYRRTFGGQAKLTLTDSGPINPDPLLIEWQGAGLILILRVGSDAAIVVVPESSGLVPGWCMQPDATARSKLATLAVELGSLLLPEEFTATDGTAAYVQDLGAALRRAELSSRAARVAIQVQGETTSGVISLVWPVTKADAVLDETRDAAETESPSKVAADAGNWADPSLGSTNGTPGPEETDAFPANGTERRRRIQYEDLEDGLAQLPAYSRSLLKIRVPLMVTLAESKQPLANVLDIGPGSIIHFNKPCDDTLALEIDGQKIALGEAVKVGDKFGLWITSMIMPAERFWIINNRAPKERAK